MNAICSSFFGGVACTDPRAVSVESLSPLGMKAVGVWEEQYLDFSCGVLGHPVFTFPGNPLNSA